ncbi:MAG: hypothetical protein Q7J68_00035 [Thermoplasmata archaeon]|nr:hypothetical protein [Thermoplasmata archaeon]
MYSKKCRGKKNAETAPECCESKMEPLDVCTTASSQEHSRPMGTEEPCDDGRGA